MEIKVIRKQESSELYHHGVKGMKWGVRRYQNKDGSLTAAGKKRHNQMDSDAESLSDSMYSYAKKVNRANSLIDAGKRNSHEYLVAEESVRKASHTVQKVISELDKKYVNINAIPEFDNDGYTIKYVKTTMTKLDDLGRVERQSTRYRPVDNDYLPDKIYKN